MPVIKNAGVRVGLGRIGYTGSGGPTGFTGSKGADGAAGSPGGYSGSQWLADFYAYNIACNRWTQLLCSCEDCRNSNHNSCGPTPRFGFVAAAANESFLVFILII